MSGTVLYWHCVAKNRRSFLIYIIFQLCFVGSLLHADHLKAVPLCTLEWWLLRPSLDLKIELHCLMLPELVLAHTMSTPAQSLMLTMEHRMFA